MNNRNLILAALAILGAPTALAHHNWAALYDVGSDVEIAGTVTSIEWRNPHVRLEITVDSGLATEKTWHIASNSVGNLSRMGVTPELLTVGATVKAAGYIARNADDDLFMNNLLLPDGREVIFKRGAEPRWTAESVGTSDVLHGKVVEQDISKRPSSLFAVWTTVFNVAESHELMPKDSAAYPMTEQAIKQVADLDFINNYPLAGCTPKGMPFAMAQPYPIELADDGDKVLIRIEEYDAVREVNLSEDHDDQAVSPSRLGYSTGRWEDDKLIVTTSKIDYEYLNVGTQPLPIPQSPEVRTIETFQLSDDHNRLDYTLNVLDPAMLKEPMTFRKYFQWRPGAEVEPYLCSE